jgi:hypothetical protein
MDLDDTVFDFLHLIGDRPPENRDRSPAYVTAIAAIIPDFDPDPDNGHPVLEAFETQIALTKLMAFYTGFNIGEEEVHLAAGKRGYFSLPAILPGQFRHSSQAFENFALESIRFRCTSNLQVYRGALLSSGALRLLQTIFEALQDGVVTTTTKRLESPTGVAHEIFAMDWDAVDQQDADGCSDYAGKVN